MDVLTYDGSFAGLLTAIFEIYEYRYQQPEIYPETAAQAALFGVTHHVNADKAKAARVFKKLQQHLPPVALSKLYAAFLSEEPGMPTLLFRYARYAIESKTNVDDHFSHPDVTAVGQLAKRVLKEAHRMKGFTRFQLSRDKLYFALIQPDHNVLPLIRKHFKNRFADQTWLIYDLKRKYGVYYNLNDTIEVTLQFHPAGETNTAGFALDEDDVFYQNLWKVYFKSTFNPGRKNTKLHVQFLPKRYWKHLTEKLTLNR